MTKISEGVRNAQRPKNLKNRLNVSFLVFVACNCIFCMLPDVQYPFLLRIDVGCVQ